MSGLKNQFIIQVIEKNLNIVGLLPSLTLTITHSVLHIKMFDYQAKNIGMKPHNMIQQIESISLVVQFAWSIK